MTINGIYDTHPGTGQFDLPTPNINVHFRYHCSTSKLETNIICKTQNKIMRNDFRKEKKLFHSQITSFSNEKHTCFFILIFTNSFNNAYIGYHIELL